MRSLTLSFLLGLIIITSAQGQVAYKLIGIHLSAGGSTILSNYTFEQANLTFISNRDPKSAFRMGFTAQLNKTNNYFYTLTGTLSSIKYSLTIAERVKDYQTGSFSQNKYKLDQSNQYFSIGAMTGYKVGSGSYSIGYVLDYYISSNVDMPRVQLKNVRLPQMKNTSNARINAMWDVFPVAGKGMIKVGIEGLIPLTSYVNYSNGDKVKSAQLLANVELLRIW
ncbi:MAG: hypothetical protein RIF34_09680, partial [Candidatus Kapaibacterium sp.]